jgi:RNA polymerase sigma factor (sigma-70 family)
VPLAELASYSCDGAPALDALVLAELDQAFRECREQLGPKYRQVWEARFEEDRDPQETADELGIPRAQVAVRLHRARAALEECLRRKGALE